MDFDNFNNEREKWREQKRKWREERRQWRDPARRRQVSGMAGMYTSGHNGGHGHKWTGIFILIVGVVALLKATVPGMPPWVFGWQMLLIAMGFFIGIRHNFRGGFWFILIVIGSIFLINDYFPEVGLHNYLWPLALIVVGLFFIFKPRRRDWQYWSEYGKENKNTTEETDTNTTSNFMAFKEDTIDSTSIFGGIKKNVISKNFKGGDITNIMGGSEIDLSQADINGTATMDITQIFGGTKLIVPSNWQVKTQMAAIFGGVEDKRNVQNAVHDPNKILILDGTSIFGGIEIRSY